MYRERSHGEPSKLENERARGRRKKEDCPRTSQVAVLDAAWTRVDRGRRRGKRSVRSLAFAAGVWWSSGGLLLLLAPLSALYSVEQLWRTGVRYWLVVMGAKMV